jgi:excisionase family DNA binding protein
MVNWLSVAEAATHANVSKDTIYTACERGEIRHVRLGGRRAIRLTPEWVDEWLVRHTVPVRPQPVGQSVPLAAP